MLEAWHSKNTLGTREELGNASLIMDWRSPHNKWWMRLVAVTLTLCFIYQDVVWAQDGQPVWSKPVNEKWGQSPSGTVPISLNANIAIPKDIATVKEAYKASSIPRRGQNYSSSLAEDRVEKDNFGLARDESESKSKTVIQIQDAHASLAAQESISSILDSLVTNYDLKLVAVEGSSGYIDTSILKTFPDEGIRRNTAEYLMQKGKMSAGEFYSVTSNKNIALYGIEDKDLYKANVEEFKKIYEANQSVRKDITGLINTLKAIEDKVYSKELKALEDNSVLNTNGKVSFTDRWAYISALASKVGIDINGKMSQSKGTVPFGDSPLFPNLSKLVESIKLEKEISFDKANKERDALIDVLSKSITKTELEKLVLNSLSFKQGKITQGEYYVFLQGLANDNNVSPLKYKNLINFTDYITLYESIDLLEIFEEAKVLEDAIKDRLYTSPDQRKLHDLLKCANFIKDIFDLKLTNSDFEYLAKSLKTWNADTIAQFIEETGNRVGYTSGNRVGNLRGCTGDDGYDLDNIFSNLPIAIQFYNTAERRNNVILNNTISRMNKEGQTVAALITGGYHTKGISELLKQKETSYLVILPKFDASKPERPYVAILTNKKDNYEELLESGKYQLLTDNYLKDGIQDPKKIEGFIKEIVVVSIGQAAIERKDIASVKKLWIESYRRSYEALMEKGIVKKPSSEPGAAEGSSEKFSKPGLGKGNRFYKPGLESQEQGYGDQHIATTTNFSPVALEKFIQLIDDINAIRISDAVAVVELGDTRWTIAISSDNTITRREPTPAELRGFNSQLRKIASQPASTEHVPSAAQRVKILEGTTRDLLIDAIVERMHGVSTEESFDDAVRGKTAYTNLTVDGQREIRQAVMNRFKPIETAQKVTVVSRIPEAFITRNAQAKKNKEERRGKIEVIVKDAGQDGITITK
ncbi:MAG: hypothetical protein PHS46_06265, partial [Candidatus Omnitrophica bacterium]|nr:hypothetical protein [Candidatus Omnitrophota bacterium]